MRTLIKRLVGRRIIDWLRGIVYSPIRLARPYFDYDIGRFVKYSGVFSRETREQLRSYVIMQYHIIEKGLTMPNRRLGFGMEVIRKLMAQIVAFEHKFGSDSQVTHAIGVLKTYWELHFTAGAINASEAFWQELDLFLGNYPSVESARQLHFTREDFYKEKDAVFPRFALARHTSRHYSEKSLDVKLLRNAVEIAISTPTACNRQHCRVYCVSDKKLMADILHIQGGSRGFGHFADKLLIVTANLEDLNVVRERNDLFVNGGMFLMNLCYSLFYNEIAHCILNWSRTPDEDMRFRTLVGIKESETVIAILTCGVPPEEFDVCASPRKPISEYFVEL